MRLERHIEVLLTRYDCVVVRGFGGFVKHHIRSTYSEADGVMLPPREVVGFDGRLTMNDSLVVQSYVDAYDYSYPEAEEAVEAEVEELRRILRDGKGYELGAVGELTMKDDGTIGFEPSGVELFEPAIYGFRAIEVARRDELIKEEEATEKKEEEETNTININIDDKEEVGTEEEAEGVYTIRIARRTLRRAAAVAVLMVVTAGALFVGRNVDTRKMTSGWNWGWIYSLVPKTGMTDNGSVNAMAAEATTTEEEAATTDNEGAAGSAVTEAEAEYTVVLASKVTEENARRFVETLRDAGVEARQMPQGRWTRVVCGAFATMDEAREARRELAGVRGLEDSWVARCDELR